MISRSVAQIATASMRTSTSARFGAGTGLVVNVSCSGSPNTQAFIVSGIGKSGEVLTLAGWYICISLDNGGQSFGGGILDGSLENGAWRAELHGKFIGRYE
jgi:hypothetical protein